MRKNAKQIIPSTPSPRLSSSLPRSLHPSFSQQIHPHPPISSQRGCPLINELMFWKDSSCGLVQLRSISKKKFPRWDASRLFAPGGGDGGEACICSSVSGLSFLQHLVRVRASLILILALKASDSTHYILRA